MNRIISYVSSVLKPAMNRFDIIAEMMFIIHPVLLLPGLVLGDHLGAVSIGLIEVSAFYVKQETVCFESH
ncbi:MAG: hypothetical protein P9M00_04610 [Candidatus Tritonobacter lacicola]|nr:hypothetical protein [Candidatus Tritonobacter lacicola]